MKNEKIKAGGVALYNGIIFASRYKQINIDRKENGKISCRTYTNPNTKKDFWEYIPIARGIIGIGSQVGNTAGNFVRSIDKADNATKFGTFIAYAVAILALIGIPIGISALVPENYRSFIQVLGIILEFDIYLSFLKTIPQLKQVYKYHGAEHKVVNAAEKLPFDELTLENVKKQSRIHKRCGGNLIVYFIMLTILTMFIPTPNLWFKLVFTLGMALVNIGLANEIVEIISILPRPLDIIGYPASLIQYLTTREPDDDMLQLALYGIRACVNPKAGISIEKYIQNYISRNNLKDYDMMDIYKIMEYVTKRDVNELQLKKGTLLINMAGEILADELLDSFYFKGTPLQYLTHKQYFYNEEYYVDENVLIPQPDSEILVEKAVEYVKNEENIVRIIDLCTGSGALGISLAKNVERVLDVELLDISDGALEVANKNIVKNEVQDRVCTCKSDLLEEVINAINSKEAEEQEELKVHMIISNPPYIRTSVIETLPEDVKQEPHLALDGGEDGLVFYRKIVEQAKEVLLDNGLLIFEIGYDQLEDLKNIIKENNEYTLLESVKDYGGNDRVVVCRFQHK